MKKKKSPLYVSGFTTALMMAPYTFFLVLMIIIPIVSAVGLSFTNFNMIGIPNGIGLANYTNMFFSDDVFLIALRNTIVFALLTGPLGFVLSFLLAWLLNELRPVVRAVFTLLFYMPTLAGNIYFVWMYIFTGDAYGFVNSFLIRLGIIREPIMWLSDPRYNFWICVIVILWMSMGTGFLVLVAALQTLNRDLAEAGAIDGIRNRFQELIYITVPQIGPALVFATVLTVAGAFTIGYQCMQLTGFPSTDYSTHTMVLHILDFGMFRYEMGYASALAVTLFFMLMVIWRYLQLAVKKLTAE
jgi:multiple sugar transport system permease protein